MICMFKATMQSTNFWNSVIKINVRLLLPVQIAVDVDDKKKYEVLFHIHDSATMKKVKAQCSLKRVDNIKILDSYFFQILPIHGTLGHNYWKMARIKTINLKNRKL